MKTNLDLQTFETTASLGQAVAREWLDLLNLSQNEPFFVALSGGRSASALFSAIARMDNAPVLANTHFFWADERCLPPTDRESNFFMAKEQLFGPLVMSLAKIHRIRGEFPPEKAVTEANKEIERFVPLNESGLPVFDLILLGLGEDGHVASLFPNARMEVIHCRDAYQYIENSPKPPPQRISLSYAALASAKNVWVLATGKSKEEALKQSLELNAKTPLAQLLELHPGTKIFADFALSL